MSPTRRRLPVLLAAALVASACGGEPAPSAAPSGTVGPADPSDRATATDRPFAAGTFPAAGSACDLPAYTGLLGRVEAVSARTVRFTLCAPDGAFLGRLAHPALGIADASTIDSLARDPSAGFDAQGAGAFRIEAWTHGDNVRLDRVARGAASSPTPAPSGATDGAPGAPPATVVLRWVASDAERATLLREASVDGAAAIDHASAADMDTLPELSVLERPGLATAVLGFGAGKAFQLPVRQAFAQAIDSAGLATLLPAGTTAATHVSPCVVPAGCAGKPWWAFNGPAATQALVDAGFNRKAQLRLHVPDAPVPGLPDPAALAAAIRDQLTQSIGVTVAIDTMPAADLGAAIDAGTIDGMYLWGVASPLADPAGFLEPLFGAGVRSSAASRAKGVRAALADAARSSGPGAREVAFAAANAAIRASVPVIPLVHPGSAAAYRADVAGASVSPLGMDPLGSFVPADRRQLVVAVAGEPAGAWCGAGATEAAYALCALVTPGLFGFDGASLDPVPALASACTANADATEWTCRLRAGLRTPAGHRIDAGDVLASVRALADAGSPLRAALPAEAFAAYDALVGGPVPAAAP
jgi:peptide/nickel transport system substrate-binding protein